MSVNGFLMWRDSPTYDINTVIAAGCERHREKYGTTPTEVMVSEVQASHVADGDLTITPDVRVPMGEVWLISRPVVVEPEPMMEGDLLAKENRDRVDDIAAAIFDRMNGLYGHHWSDDLSPSLRKTYREGAEGAIAAMGSGESS